MAEVAYGDSGTDLPPVQLPSLGTEPPPIPHVIISKAPPPPGKGGNAADDFPAYTPPAKTETTSPPSAAVDPNEFPEYAPTEPPPPKVPRREVGGMEAAGRGVANAATLGFAPALAGLAEASGIPSKNPGAQEFDPNPLRPLIGAYKMIDDWIAGHKNPDVTAAYERGRKSYEGEQEQGAEQHPYHYGLGQLAGALMIPMGAGGTAVGAAARIGRTALAGGITGGLTSTGEQVSAGKLDQIPKEALKGAVTGAAFGGVGGAGAEIAGKTAGRVMQIVRGKLDTEGEAARRLLYPMAKDSEARALAPAITAEEGAAGRRAGTDMRVLDFAGPETRAAVRQASNISPTGRTALEEFTEGRFHDQSRRIGRRIRSFIGGGNVADDMDILNTLARKANAPAYRASNAFGQIPMTGEMRRLTSSKDVQQALKNAIESSSSRDVAEGFGGYHTPLKVGPDGNILNLPLADMQLWDYAQRELRAMATKAKAAGDFDRYGYLTGIQKQLLAELDKINPAFARARGTAATFFKANNMLEAGENFVREDINMQHAAKILSALNPVERELFRRGFAAELADQIEKIADKRNVLDSIFVNNGPARQKILLAMGSQDARELEALLRVEAIVDNARKMLGGSQTARYITEAAHMTGAGTAVGAIEALKEGDINPVHFLTAAFTYGLAKKGAHIIDEKVARRMSEMVLSKDPAVLARAYKIVANSPALFEALRHATASASRISAQDIGPEKAAAAAATGLHNVIHVGSPVRGHEHENRNPNVPDRTSDDEDIIPH